MTAAGKIKLSIDGDSLPVWTTIFQPLKPVIIRYMQFISEIDNEAFSLSIEYNESGRIYLLKPAFLLTFDEIGVQFENKYELGSLDSIVAIPATNNVINYIILYDEVIV